TLPHINEALLKSTPLYDPIKDLDPIAAVAANVLCIAVHPSVPVRSLKELVVYAKANPGKLSYGHAGLGSIQQPTRQLSKSLAPAGTPPAIIEQIAQATRTAAAEPAWQQMLIDAGIEPVVDSNPEAFRRSLAADVALWSPVVKALGVTID